MRSLRWLSTLAALTALPLAGGSLAAQAHATGIWDTEGLHTGAFIAGGGGLGAAHVSCTGCATLSHEISPSFWIRAGGTVSRHLLIGAEVDTWYANVDGERTIIANGSLTGYYYPQIRSGLYFKGGLGPSIYQVRNGSTFKSVGIGLLLGAGYDYRIGHNLFLTPSLSMQLGKQGNLTKVKGSGGPLPNQGGTLISNATWAKNVKTNVIMLGVSLTYAE